MRPETTNCETQLDPRPQDDTQQFLELMFASGDIVALTVLGATFRSSNVPVGFYTDRKALLAKVKELDGQGNVYININELSPSVLDRGENQFNAFARQRFSGDEIVRRRTLVIDLDPERPSGINSTDEELRAAVTMAKRIEKYLREQWGVEPLVMISGNGTQLLYRIDEPTDSDIVARVLRHLHERFSDDKVKVDTSLSDLPRITRLPGTLNMKGEHTEDRPRRYASIYTAPESMFAVTTEQLESLLPAVADRQTASTGTWTHDRLRALLDNQYAAYEGRGWKYRIKSKPGKGFDGDLVYELEQCPFVEHREEFEYRSMVWLKDGVPCFKCFSPDCDGADKKTFGDFLRTIAPRPIEDATDERRLAKVFLDDYSHPDGYRLRCYRGEFWVWNGFWQRLPEDVFKDRLYAACKADLDRIAIEIMEQAEEDDKPPRVAKVSNALLASVTTAIKSLVSLDTKLAPCWVDGRHDGEFIAFADCILDLTAWIQRDEQIVHNNTPAYFTTNPLDYPFEFTEVEPDAMLTMLQAQDMTPSEIEALQEFGGLCFTPMTRFQKALLMTGPPRSGKGTYERVLTACIGQDNAANKDFNQFNGAHSLEDLPGKTLLGVSDHRQHDSRAVRSSVGRLLGIIGEDRQNINPKNLRQYTEKLAVKVMICTNQVPDFHDATDALLSRFIFVKTRLSFAGREDTGLEVRILQQRNQATWWFLRGLKRLVQRGQFVQPDNGVASMFRIRNAPIQCFVEACCELSGKMAKDALYEAFADWCEDHGLAAMAMTEFMQQLYATYPVRSERPTVQGRRQYVASGIRLK